MSKAFVKDDGDNQDDELERDDAALPQGVKNYITPQGAERLRSELKELLDVKRPEIVQVVSWAAGNGDRSENGDYIYGKRRLREIDRRIRFLTKRLELAEIIDPTKIKGDIVRFGATVTVETEKGEEKIFKIVGIDEIDAKRGHVSWVSPIGKALLKHAEGDSVPLQTPNGEEELTIIAVKYLPIE